MNCRKNEFIVFISFFLFFTITAAVFNCPKIHPNNFHFGGEYGNIAASIAQGKGFSNPFNTDSGPTSWMPPTYPYLLSFIFKLFGTKTASSVVALLLIKYLALSIIPVLLLRICRDLSTGLQPYTILPIYLVLIVYSFTTFFLLTQDIWLVMLLMTVLLYMYVRKFIDQDHLKTLGFGWSVLGAVIILTCPTLGVVFMVLTLLPFTKAKWHIKISLIALSFVISSPWFIRNYLVFEKVIFVKSNLFFDMFQSNYLDEDGLLDLTTFEDFHPYENKEVNEYYTRVGEKAFMADYRTRLFTELQNRPQDFVGKSIRRLIHIYFVYPPVSKTQISGVFGTHVVPLAKLIIYSLPLILSAFLIFKHKSIDKRITITTFLAFIFALMPYVLVGFSRRYRIPLLPVFSMIYFQFIIYFISRIKPRENAQDVAE